MSDLPQIEAAWRRIVGWLAWHAPRSHATLLPPATEAEIAEGQSMLASAWRPDGEEPLSFPAELVALWRLCASATNNGAGVEGDEEGELWPELFFPREGIFLPPRATAQARLNVDAVDGGTRYWTPPHNIPCVVKYPDAVESGLYIQAPTGPVPGAMGRFAVYEGYDIGEPSFPSLAAYLGAVAEALEDGTGPLGEDTGYRPAVSLGCLVWLDPDDPHLEDVPWELVHPHHG